MPRDGRSQGRGGTGRRQDREHEARMPHDGRCQVWAAVSRRLGLGVVLIPGRPHHKRCVRSLGHGGDCDFEPRSSKVAA